MPESISSWAEPTKPAERMTSLPARTMRLVPSLSMTATPVARPFSMTTLVTMHLGLQLQGGHVEVVDVAA